MNDEEDNVSHNNVEKRLCHYLKEFHSGREKAVSSKELEAAFSMKGTEIRKTVNALRCAGNPICSDSFGYYFAATQEEIRATVLQLNSRITKIAKARNGLLSSDSVRWTGEILSKGGTACAE
jgi:NADH/NAD ratio-sensing transcriptional regulator Rex